MSLRKLDIARRVSTGVVAGILSLSTAFFAPVASAGSLPSLSGSILGQVKSADGVAQMGATVLLYNRSDQLLRQVFTNEQGRFAFAALNPDIYSIRVTLASFVPALRRNIAVASGSENLLQINMTGVFSTVEIIASGAHGTLMSDDWKWVLRSSPATRPVLRFLPNDSSSKSSSLAGMFSDTQGMVKLSAGDSDFAGGGIQDMGTAFALATSIYGNARVQFSGNVGYAANAALPAAGFSTTYSRSANGGASNPEVTLTVRQMYLPWSNSSPALRTATLGMVDRLDLSDQLHLEYGFNYESVTFLDRLNYVSPFARATYDLGKNSTVSVAFSSGTQPTQLLPRNGEGGELNQEIAALAQMPLVSLADSRARVQRNETFEIGYKRVAGSRTYTASVYSESISNGAFLLSGPAGFLPASDLLPQLGSASQVFDVGNYNRMGYSVGVTQSIGDHFDVSAAGGRAGALVAGNQNVFDANGLRDDIQKTQRTWLSARVSTTIPVTGMRIGAGYGWSDFNALMPTHYSLVDRSNQDVGLNIYVRQPLPALPGMFGSFGRFEATAELRNLLAQGYLPVTVDGQHAVMTNTPRAVRGGLSFIF